MLYSMFFRTLAHVMDLYLFSRCLHSNRLTFVLFFGCLMVSCCKTENTTYIQDGQICRLCPPGMHRLEYCIISNGSLVKDTNCAFCKEGETYTAHHNKGSECHKCSHFCGKLFSIMVRECSTTHNIICSCKRGFYLKRKMDPYCRLIKVCGVGYGVKVPGTSRSDVICEKCEGDYFSSVKSSYASCRRRTNCSSLEKALLSEGNSTTDNICEDDISSTSTVPEDSHGLLELFTVNTPDKDNDNDTLPKGKLVGMLVNGNIIVGILVPLLITVLVIVIYYRENIRQWYANKFGNSILIGDGVDQNLSKEPLVDSPDMHIKETTNKVPTTQQCREADVHQARSFPDARQVRNRRSVGSYSETKVGAANDLTEMKPLYTRSRSSESQNLLPPCPEFQLWEMTDVQFMFFTSESIVADDNKWRKFLLSLPGAVKMEENYITRAWVDNIQPNGITHVIYMCMMQWHQNNPEIDVVNGVIEALERTKEPFNQQLADSIKLQKSKIPKTTTV